MAGVMKEKYAPVDLGNAGDKTRASLPRDLTASSLMFSATLFGASWHCLALRLGLWAACRLSHAEPRPRRSSPSRLRSSPCSAHATSALPTTDTVRKSVSRSLSPEERLRDCQFHCQLRRPCQGGSAILGMTLNHPHYFLTAL
jgi:hypothetical protein